MTTVVQEKARQRDILCNLNFPQALEHALVPLYVNLHLKLYMYVEPSGKDTIHTFSIPYKFLNTNMNELIKNIKLEFYFKKEYIQYPY